MTTCLGAGGGELPQLVIIKLSQLESLFPFFGWFKNGPGRILVNTYRVLLIGDICLFYKRVMKAGKMAHEGQSLGATTHVNTRQVCGPSVVSLLGRWR